MHGGFRSRLWGRVGVTPGPWERGLKEEIGLGQEGPCSLRKSELHPKGSGEPLNVLGGAGMPCSSSPTAQRSSVLKRGADPLQPEDSHSPAAAWIHRKLTNAGQIYQRDLLVPHHLGAAHIPGRNIWAGNVTWKRRPLSKRGNSTCLSTPLRANQRCERGAGQHTVVKTSSIRISCPRPVVPWP